MAFGTSDSIDAYDPTQTDWGVPPMLDPNYPNTSVWSETPPSVLQIPTSPSGQNTTGSTFGTALSSGLSILGTVLGYKLQQNQINHGMYPSVGYQNGFMPTGQPVSGLGGLSSLSGGWIWLILIAVFLLLILRR